MGKLSQKIFMDFGYVYNTPFIRKTKKNGDKPGTIGKCIRCGENEFFIYQNDFNGACLSCDLYIEERDYDEKLKEHNIVPQLNNQPAPVIENKSVEKKDTISISQIERLLNMSHEELKVYNEDNILDKFVVYLRNNNSTEDYYKNEIDKMISQSNKYTTGEFNKISDFGYVPSKDSFNEFFKEVKNDFKISDVEVFFNHFTDFIKNPTNLINLKNFLWINYRNLVGQITHIEIYDLFTKKSICTLTFSNEVGFYGTKIYKYDGGEIYLFKDSGIHLFRLQSDMSRGIPTKKNKVKNYYSYKGNIASLQRNFKTFKNYQTIESIYDSCNYVRSINPRAYKIFEFVPNEVHKDSNVYEEYVDDFYEKMDLNNNDDLEFN